MPKRPDTDYPSPHTDAPAAPPHPTPLAVILRAMWAKNDAGDLAAAAALARIAAPYLHARCPAAAPATDLAALADADLDAIQPPE